MTAFREYVVTERMRTEQVYYVLASSRQEAIERATAEDCLWVEKGDVVPVRPLRVSDARLIRNPKRVATPIDSGEADPGLLLILLGAGLAVLAGAAALAIATGVFG